VFADERGAPWKVFGKMMDLRDGGDSEKKDKRFDCMRPFWPPKRWGKAARTRGSQLEKSGNARTRMTLFWSSALSSTIKSAGRITCLRKKRRSTARDFRFSLEVGYRSEMT
jgi:hypothetical protein